MNIKQDQDHKHFFLFFENYNSKVICEDNIQQKIIKNVHDLL